MGGEDRPHSFFIMLENEGALTSPLFSKCLNKSPGSCVFFPAENKIYVCFAALQHPKHVDSDVNPVKSNRFYILVNALGDSHF